MTFLKSTLLKGALAASVITGSLAVVSLASANVVCNRWNECWRVRDRLDYPAGLRMTFHNDAWGVAHRSGHYTWRDDRFDRGYYRNGVWIAL